MRAQCESKDLSGSWLAWFIWGLPAGAIVLGVLWREARVWLWFLGLIAAGTGCLVNAARCRRLHCYFTGPLYLTLSVFVLLRGLGILPLGWMLVPAVLVSGTALALIAERARGRYRGR